MLMKVSAFVIAATGIMAAVIAVGGFVTQVQAQPAVDESQNERMDQIEKKLDKIPAIFENTERILKRLPSGDH